MKYPTFIIAVFIVLNLACQQNDLYSPPVEVRENTADFVINNNSGQDIGVTYVTSSKLGFKESESHILIPNQSTTKIFDVTFVGEFPFPSSAFYTLSFYYPTASGFQKVVEAKPVVDEDWTVLEQNLDSEGFGYTMYQLAYFE